jgi:hypothetical protein
METNHSMENFRETQPEIKEFKDMDREAVENIGKKFRDSPSFKEFDNWRDKPSDFKTPEEFKNALKREVNPLVNQEMSIMAQREVNPFLKDAVLDANKNKTDGEQLANGALADLQKEIDIQERKSSPPKM